ncbi:MAG: protoporphyrinogen oxidase [Solirubrobacteraceae bacterium]
MSADTPHAVVIGAGITGLAAAHSLVRLTGPGALTVTVLDADDRLGGKIRTEAFAGRAVDAGPEMMLTRVAQAPALCRELGLEHELVAPATDRPYVRIGGRLHPLPPRLLAGVPGGARAVMSTRVLSAAGLARAGLDLVVPSRPPRHDVSIGELVRRRLGNEVLERLIDPLLGGIHAGSCDELSVRATAPQLESALESGRGLIRGLRAAAGGSPEAPSRPPFVSLSGGLAGLVRALEARLQDVEIRTGAHVRELESLPTGQIGVRLSGDAMLTADQVVLAVPAFAASSLLGAVCPVAARELEAIDYASVATVLLSYPDRALTAPLNGSGFLVARGEGCATTACTWSSAKWSHLSGETVVLKASVGRAYDRRALELDDERLVARVHRDLAEVMGLCAAPLEARVVRFEQALPQYRVGHLDLVARIDAALAGLPNVHLAGAAYRGVGVGACIRDGQRAAAAIASELAMTGFPLTAGTT